MFLFPLRILSLGYLSMYDIYTGFHFIYIVYVLKNQADEMSLHTIH